MYMYNDLKVLLSAIYPFLCSLNIFYDDCYCLSFESHDESEEDIREIAGRLHTLSPSLTSSHEVSLR